MKLAFSNLAWSAADEPAVSERLRHEGVSGVELVPSKIWARAPQVPDGAAEGCAAWWRERGQTIVALQSIFFGRPALSLFGDETPFAEHVEAMARLAQRCGARVLVFGAPANRQRGARELSEAMAVAASLLRRVAERIAPYGVSLCIEPNPPRYGCDFVTTAAEAAQLAQAVGHEAFGVHLDATALAMSGETTADALTTVMPFVRHFHVSELDLVPVGTSERVPHAQIGRALREAGYRGWVSVEMKLRERDRWATAIPRAAAVARECYLG